VINYNSCKVSHFLLSPPPTLFVFAPFSIDLDYH
jgi:hypothetical protein